MPHVVFDAMGLLSATARGDPRQLIPGIDPGGSRAGHATKPALLIKNAWLEPIDVNVAIALGTNQATYGLILSQDQDLTPGLFLPIGAWGEEYSEQSGVGREVHHLGSSFMNLWHASGTVWVPRFVGIFMNEVGSVNTDVDVHLDYERIDIPWMNWFIKWDWLDNVVDGQRDY